MSSSTEAPATAAPAAPAAPAVPEHTLESQDELPEKFNSMDGCLYETYLVHGPRFDDVRPTKAGKVPYTHLTDIKKLAEALSVSKGKKVLPFWGIGETIAFYVVVCCPQQQSGDSAPVPRAASRAAPRAAPRQQKPPAPTPVSGDVSRLGAQMESALARIAALEARVKFLEDSK